MEDYVDEHLMVMNKHSFKIKYVHAIDLGYWGNFPQRDPFKCAWFTWDRIK